MRAGWRGLCVMLTGGAFFLLAFRGPEWSVLRQSDTASWLALVAGCAMLFVVAAGLAISACRWLLLAAWPASVGVWCEPRDLVLRFGPFGTHRFDVARVGLLESDGDDDAWIDDDELVLRGIRHPGFAGDLAEEVVRFCGPRPEMMRALRQQIAAAQG